MFTTLPEQGKGHNLKQKIKLLIKEINEIIWS